MVVVALSVKYFQDKLAHTSLTLAQKVGWHREGWISEVHGRPV